MAHCCVPFCSNSRWKDAHLSFHNSEPQTSCNTIGCDNWQDAGVWIPHSETVWEGAVVTRSYKKDDDVILITSESGELREVKIKDEKDLPPLRNPQILIGQNDLTALSYLNEPDVLSCLEVRFVDRQAIYTYCGIVLVAINPYYDLPLYGPDIIRAYRGHAMGELEPHIFAVAEEAYAKLEREKCDISIIVSGESGAGKTVSAKYAMRYFAAVGGSEDETQIEKKVLASSPIMEAIGNAKTTRNDNSSRFGKFTKLIFVNDSSIMSLTGGTMQTYLLEKSRVVFQTADERNYHIFYQLCAARSDWPELMLDHPDKFHFLNQGRSPDIEKVSDFDQFKETVNACRILGFTTEDVNDIMRTLAGILHLGNVNFSHKDKKNSEEIDNEGCDIKDNDLFLNVLSDILKVDKHELRKWLVNKQIESGHECLLIPITKRCAEAARDALAKHIYAKLFQYIVEKINKNLLSSKKQHNFIGVLDIYGFETFDLNSFEQFCINYANEKLQQQFNQHVFKLEQEEYLKEGIVWTMIDFYDNQPCIDLIEAKLGILDLLDEECRMPKGSDESWTGKLFEKCAKYKHFDKPRFGAIAFIVKHFSDTVRYESQGFLEKNRDNVSKELVNTIRLSGMSFLKKIIDLGDGTLKASKSAEMQTPGVKIVISASKAQTLGRQHKKTVGSQFRESLNLLITTLHATTPHYVRCIKPNDNKTAFKWDPKKIIQQLRACGVLETVRISAAGFPSRWSYEDFYGRYRLLCKRKQIVEWNVKATCKNIIRNWLQDEDKYRLGNTQLFFRAGQVAFLEQLRSDIRKKHIIFVQALIRRFIYRKKYLRLKRISLGLQARCRGLLARRRAQVTRETRAAIVIQRFTRGWLCRNKYKKLRHSILGLQKYARGLLARKKFQIALKNHKITQIQRLCRGYLARIRFKRKQKGIILAQAMVRAFLARRLYKKLKAEARTISHIQKMYKGLENKIIELQQKIDNLNKENGTLKVQTSEMAEMKIKLEAMRNMENELKSLKQVLKDKESNFVNLTKQFEQERDEKMTILEQKVKGEADLKKQNEILEIENLELKKQVTDIKETAKKDDQTARTRLLSDVDSNELHYAYQKTVKDKDLLESENNALKKELQRYKNLIIHQHDLNSLSPRNSISPNPTDDDGGYSSAKNTLELRRKSLTAEAFTALRENINQVDRKDSTSIIIKLRKLLEEEKNKGELLKKEIKRRTNMKTGAFSTEDSLRLSEMELENEKLREDYHLLRNSIKRGVEHQELEAHYNAVLEELTRRREECIQLKAVLSQQSQSIKLLGQQPLSKRESDRMHDENELQEAFSAQKLVNRQLESELTALTQENNAKLEELSIQLDTVRREKLILQEILQEKLDQDDDEDIESIKQNENYLRYELELSTLSYVELQEQMNELTKKMNDLIKKNTILANRLVDHGINSEAEIHTDNNIAMLKKKAQNIQGILKYRYEDEEKILQRLINDLKPRVAITLLPGLPAYIVFMCIRYTDMVNTDQHVRTLLSNFVISVKKLFKLPNATECRVLWLVNTLTLHNLLKQYGGIEEYTKFNTEIQNQQQLKNFDLSEYRQVIHENIINIYGIVVRQVQELIKQYIVPAILDHDEMERGRSHGKPSRTMSLDISPEDRKPKGEPSSLVNQLEYYYKQFTYFGLDECYIEQLFKQLMYYICAVSLNNLMLRQDLCTWKTGMKIRYNVSCLEDWIRRKKMSNDVLGSLLPLIQVSSLLQSRKTEEDVQTICDISTSLTAATVLKIIKSYKWDDCENPIKPVFIEKLKKQLQDRLNHRGGNDVFTMEESFVNPLIVVYKYSDIKLDEIEVPSCLNLSELLIKI